MREKIAESTPIYLSLPPMMTSVIIEIRKSMYAETIAASRYRRPFVVYRRLVRQCVIRHPSNMDGRQIIRRIACNFRLFSHQPYLRFVAKQCGCRQKVHFDESFLYAQFWSGQFLPGRLPFFSYTHARAHALFLFLWKCVVFFVCVWSESITYL